MKNILKIISFSDTPNWVVFLLLLIAIFSGLTGFAFVFLINKVTKLFINGGITMYDIEYCTAFALIIFLFFVTRRLLTIKVINLSQKVFWNIRKKIVKLLSRSRYYDTQNLKDQIYAVIHHDAKNLLEASMVIIEFFAAIIVIVACFGYMAYFSFILFCFSLITLFIGVIIYQFGINRSNAHFKISRELESGFLKNFDAIFYGLKEINMSPKKGLAIYNQNISPVLSEGYNRTRAAYIGYTNSQIIGQLAFYILIAFILLHLGFIFKLETSIIINYTFLLLFILRPIETVMSTIPSLNRAYISLTKMVFVIDKLSEQASSEPLLAEMNEKYKTHFSKIKVSNLAYNYKNREGFSLGPINFEINASDTIFIYGGNGSGKSSFIKLMIQLIVQKKGTIELDGQLIDENNRNQYRNLFSVVFSDFYLFDKIYGIDNIDKEQVQEYLKLFEVDKKITIENGTFSSTDLSTGQRKRLAIIAALLENKPILVLDEWAADQDPMFRKKFYKEILPLLKQKGITIIAITHDDAYYSSCDRIYKMDYGKMHEKKNLQHSLLTT